MILNRILLCACVIPFALMPLATALWAHRPVLAPSVVAVVTDGLFLTAVAGVLVALVCVMGAGLRLAISAVSAGLFAFGMYPVALGLNPSDTPWVMLAVAWLWTLTSLAIAAFVVHRRPRADARFHRAVNAGAVVLTLLFGNNVIRTYAPAPRSVVHDDNAFAIAASPDVRPDIYHIIVDGFGHPDVLRSMYGLDTSRQVGELRRAGFTVSGDRTFANYAQTYLSLASILNGDYLQGLIALDEKTPSRAVVRDLIQGSRVVRSLKDAGYTFELLSGPYPATEGHRLADVCECSRPVVGEFESTMIRLTPLGQIGLGDLDHGPHRRKVLKTLDALERLSASGGPRLMLAHVLSPHPPFVFDADGEAVRPRRVFTINDGTFFAGSESEYQSGYRAQAAFIAARLPRIAAHLEAVSRSQGRASVIVIHGDHGPRHAFDAYDASRSNGAESLPVFLAIRWSDGPPAPTVTSLVNIYRAIFQRYFIPELALLPDRAYMSSFARPYAFLEVDPVTFGQR